MKSLQLTTNFNLKEFHCKDGTEVPECFYPNVIVLARNLQLLRDEIKKPVVISGSGYRTAEHNKSVGGAKESQHLTASAADISVPGMTPKDLAAVIERMIREGRMKQGGIGIYKTFVHYDIRGIKSRWNG